MKEKKYQVAKNVVFKEAQGLIYIIDAKRDKLRSLNEVATSIWKHLQKKRTLNQLANLLSKEYDAPQDILEKDCRKFIQKYTKIGLIKTSF